MDYLIRFCNYCWNSVTKSNFDRHIKELLFLYDVQIFCVFHLLKQFYTICKTFDIGIIILSSKTNCLSKFDFCDFVCNHVRVLFNKNTPVQKCTDTRCSCFCNCISGGHNLRGRGPARTFQSNGRRIHFQMEQGTLYTLLTTPTLSSSLIIYISIASYYEQREFAARTQKTTIKIPVAVFHVKHQHQRAITPAARVGYLAKRRQIF